MDGSVAEVGQLSGQLVSVIGLGLMLEQLRSAVGWWLVCEIVKSARSQILGSLQN